MGLSSQLASSNVLDYWPSQDQLFEDGVLQIPNPMIQARNDKNSNSAGASGGEINDQVSAQTRKHWPPLRCPRCDSTNTKFCYYNNYSKSQPRHFCKACRRHWTAGGTLRNVPVGGGRKNKRVKSGAAVGSSTAAASATTNGSAEVSNPPMIPLPPPLQQQQQHKLSGFTLFGADNISRIFPEVLRQVLLHPPPPQLQLSGNYNAMSGINLNSGPHGSVAGFPPDLLISSPPYVSGDVAATASGAWAQAGGPTTAPSTSNGPGVLEQTRGPYWSGWDDDMTDFDATRASSDAP